MLSKVTDLLDDKFGIDELRITTLLSLNGNEFLEGIWGPGRHVYILCKAKQQASQLVRCSLVILGTPLVSESLYTCVQYPEVQGGNVYIFCQKTSKPDVRICRSKSE